MSTLRWYLRGIPLALRLTWATLAGTDEQFERAARDVHAYGHARPVQ